MYKVRPSSKFEKDLKRIKKTGVRYLSPDYGNQKTCSRRTLTGKEPQSYAFRRFCRMQRMPHHSGLAVNL